MKKLTLVAVFLVGALVAVAQQKYAFLVGINKYFDSVGVQNPHELQGCVNDAYAMKAMLENRFGFVPANIATLSDAGATRQNVVNGLLALAEKCNEGDAVVFFFSGHGVWMGNDYLLSISDSIKQGMSQAMVMSDLYSEKMGCLLTDAILKKLINKFVDKKVIVTTFFDCCFSGNLPMMKGFWGHNIYDYDRPRPVEKAIPIADIFYLGGWAESDTALGFENSLQHSLNDLPRTDKQDSVKQPKGSFLKAFDMSAAINITDSERVARPSERERSMFLSLSATTDREKGQDIATETGSHQGAFTYALLKAVSSHPSDTPFETIQSDIVKIMGTQFYPQTPIFHYDSQRLKSNLIGVAPMGFKDRVRLPCANAQRQQVTFSVGTIAGIKKGNWLEADLGSNKVAIQINYAAEDSAVGKVLKGNASLIKPGQIFEVSDSYTASAPLVKIYVAGTNFTADAFDKFFDSEIMPLVKDDKYADFKNYENTDYIQPVFLQNLSPVTSKIKSSLTAQDLKSYLLFLPIPSYIIDPLKIALRKNQNVQLVNAVEKADFGLYLNYVKGSETVKPGFVLTYQRPGDFFVTMGLRFVPEKVDIPNLHIATQDAIPLTNNLEQMALKMIRKLTQQWINDYPSR